MLTWTEKYRPHRLKEVAGNPGSLRILKEWVEGWKTGIPKKRAILLYGPPGVGKTSVALALAEELGYDAIELNASDTRTKDVIHRLVGSAATHGTLDPERGKKILILDEVDGIHGRSDYGGLSALKRWIKETHQPFILIANDPWKLPPDFRSLTLMVVFKKVDSRTILKVLTQICRREGIETEERVLKVIATNSNGDLRSAINDLEALTEGRKELSLPDLVPLTMRDSELRVYDALARIFKTRSSERALEAVRECGEDPETLLKWIVENLPLEYQDPPDLARGFDRLSRSDVYFGRIRRRQDWALLRYAVDLMSAGVALAKEREYRGYIKYQYPQVFVLYARTKKERGIVETLSSRLSQKLHTSRRVAREVHLPMLRAVFSESVEMGGQVASEMELPLQEIDLLLREEERAKAIYERAKEITEGRIRERLGGGGKQAALSEF
jgi:replication factor C large subunit